MECFTKRRTSLIIYIIWIWTLNSFQFTFAQLCPKECLKGKNCMKDKCSSSKCLFTCKGLCAFREENIGEMCSSFCDPSKCSNKKCYGCLFCYGGITSSNQCNHPRFFDITSSVYSEAWSMNRWLHSGYPYPYFGPPLFADFNNDGVLDYFNPMHAHTIDVDGYKNRMELAETILIQNQPVFKPMLDNIVITDSELYSIDTHGANMVDLDNDGVLDIIIASGGGAGGIFHESVSINSAAFGRYNFLFWGREEYDNKTSGYVTVFEGGRQTAFEAGVHMEYGRGRINYIFDANGDGFLDIFSLQDRSITNEISPGILLINQGDRTWKEDNSMMEYTRSMILTDADGDGIAQEIILSRGFCFPQRNKPSANSDYPEFGEFTVETKKFCKSRPVGSIAVYKYSSSKTRMKQIGNKYKYISYSPSRQPPCCPHGTPSGAADCQAISMASGDFDGDLVADHVLLYQSKMVFYFSSDRPKGTVPSDVEHIGAEIYFPNYCDIAEALQVVDLDNDGKQEIVITCRALSTFLLYTNEGNKDEWTLNNGCNTYEGLGDLFNPLLTSLKAKDMMKLCSDGETDKTKEKACDEFNEKGFNKVIISGLCLVDINNDGFLDAVTTHNFGLLRINQSFPNVKNRFIAFDLVGDGKEVNKYGIGSTIILFSMSKGDKELIGQYREISSKHHTSDIVGCKEDRIIFGLGQNMIPVKLLIRWPNGKEQTKWLKDWSFDDYLNPIIIKYE